MVTITEALAELKLIDKRIEKKRELIGSYLVRQGHIVDPMAGHGGSRKVLEQERQAINDLLKRKLAIRSAIARANAATAVTVEGETRTISEWLVWRRDVAPAEQNLLRDLKGRIDSARAQASQRGIKTTAEESTDANVLVVNIDERALGKQAEHIEAVLAILDGQLSLKNATVTVEV